MLSYSIQQLFSIPQLNRSISFSTEPTDTNIYSKVLQYLIDKPFSLKVSKGGAVIKVENLDKIFQDTFNKFPELFNQNADPILSQIIQGFGEKMINSNLGYISLIYPHHPIALGDTWEKTYPTETIGFCVTNTDYSLKDTTNGIFQIEGTSTMVSDSAKYILYNDGSKISYSLSGNAKSLIFMDKPNGWIKNLKMDHVVEGYVVTSGAKGIPEGTKMPTRMKIEVHLYDK